MNDFQKHQQQLSNFAHQAQAVVDASDSHEGMLRLRIAEAQAGQEVYWNVIAEVQARYDALQGRKETV